MVMHARKPQRMSDGYFEKHQAHPYQSSKYSSKRDYERDTSSRTSNYGRDRDNSPSAGGGSSLNNGSSSYRSNSPDLESSPRHDIRERDRDRDRFSYLQKMRERDRDVYKKDKYSDKRDRGRGSERDSEHRTNHDRIDRRSSKLCTTSSSDKRSGSDDRDRDRERDLRDSKRDRSDRDRDRERDRERDRDRDRSERDRERDRDRNDRGERVTRIGDWSEHVSSSATPLENDFLFIKFCNDENKWKFDVAMWVSGISQPDGFSWSKLALSQFINCGRFSEIWGLCLNEELGNNGKMYYYNCKTEVSQWEKPKEWVEKERTLAKDQHREYREKERERDREDRFSRSSSTYAKHSSSRSNSRLRWPYEAESGPPTHRRRHDENADMDISPGDSTPTSEASYSLSSTPTAQASEGQMQQPSGVPAVSSAITAPGPVLLANALPRLASHPSTPTNSQMHFSTPSSGVPGMVQSTATSTCLSSAQGNSNCHRKLDSVIQTTLPVSSPSQSGVGTPSSSGNHIGHHSQSQQQTAQPTGTSCVSDHHLNSNAPGPPPVTLPKMLSQISGTKQIEQNEINAQKTLQTINTALLRQQPQPHHGVLSSIGSNTVGGSEQTSTVAIIGTHNSDSNHSGSGVSNLRENPLNSPLYNLTHMHAMSPLNNKNVVSGANVVNTYNCNTPFGLKTVESGTVSGPGSSLGSSGSIGGEGPPTPTQELDLSGSSEPRKLEGTSASLSSLQSCVTSAQSGRSQGPDLSPKLAKYFRADLITHVTNWPAEILEKQAQKCSEDTHIYGDLQCTKVSAELKCARSLVRITEITATLQEQKIMYLRQQIRRLEELKSQNSFMSDDL